MSGAVAVPGQRGLPTTTGRGKRAGGRAVCVVLSAAEMARYRARAESVGLSLPAWLRKLAEDDEWLEQGGRTS